MFCIFNPFSKEKKKNIKGKCFFFCYKKEFVIIEIFVKNLIGYD